MKRLYRNLNRVFGLIILGITVVLFTQCSSGGTLSKTPEPEDIEEKRPSILVRESFKEVCAGADTIYTILISKAETVFLLDDKKYEAQVSIYAVEDSLIYVSAVNSGFEIMRALVEPDSIQVIDRVNKVLYRTPVRKRLGYQNPMNFRDIQNLVSRHYLCDDLASSRELSFSHIIFDFDEPDINKKITLNQENRRMESFEFVHQLTGKYFMGEKTEEGFTIYTNFMMGELEIRSKGGEFRRNVNIPVKMSINPKKYSIINL